MRIKAVIAYDGSRFYGFQRQKQAVPTVVGSLESALRKLNIKSDVIGSGRTDRGVHATGQVVHFDIPSYWETKRDVLHRALQRHLDAIAIRRLTAVPDTFHARYDAKKRLYRYVFKTNDVSVFEAPYVTDYRGMRTTNLQDILRLFEGTRDFAAFHKRGSDTTTTVRTVYKTHYYRYKAYHIVTFLGNAFLRSQVRLMVEAALRCANGDISRETLTAQLENKHEAVRKPAPPNGLYLARIYY